MEYNADITHRHMDFSNITVPEGLLKIKDLQDTYRSLGALELMLKQASQNSEENKKEEEIIFTEQNEQIKTLTWISGI
jgi:hypothetical protein